MLVGLNWETELMAPKNRRLGMIISMKRKKGKTFKLRPQRKLNVLSGIEYGFHIINT
jgi:hypothetical protein